VELRLVGSFHQHRGEYIYPELVAEAEKETDSHFHAGGRNDNRRPEIRMRDWFYQNVSFDEGTTRSGMK